MNFYLFCLSFFIGIFLRFILQDIFVPFIFIVSFVCAWFGFWILTKQKIYKIVFFCAVLLSVGVFCADHSLLKTSQFKNLEKTYVLLEGVVKAEPKMNDKGMQMQVEVLKVGSSTLFKKETILVGYEGYDSFVYGDTVKIGGVLELPKSFETEAGRTFNYPGYLAKDGIFFVIKKAKIERVGSVGGNFLISHLYGIKRIFVSKIESVLSSGDTALISGILLGSQDSISKNIKEDFRKSGLMHIMVLSGYNITVVGDAVSRFVNIWLSKFVSLGFGGFAIILFALLSGGGASTVRSTIMALIAIIGKISGREYDTFRTLVLVATMMVAWSPYTLLYDPSFHLSFLATAGMILLSKHIELKMVWIRFATLREIVATTLAVQIFVTPYFLWSMGSVSVISLASNILVLPIVPATMFFGFITGVSGFISTYLAFIPGFISHFLLLYTTAMAHFFASLPFAVWGL
ncbi:MAG: ComEC/Rec2 family competence protein [bacterium]